MSKKISGKKIILASSSPRRKQLLKLILSNFGLKFVVIPANIAEYIPKNASNFSVIVKNLARLKARQVAEGKKAIVIAADTIVIAKGRVLGKPSTPEEAKKSLRFLSGKKHKVYTGISIIDGYTGAEYSFFEVTVVKFRKISEREIGFYVSGGSSMDKAGAYGIQDDFGSTFAERIIGDYFNVVGLPIVKTYLGLQKMKVLEI